jgi:hypothetical protein
LGHSKLLLHSGKHFIFLIEGEREKENTYLRHCFAFSISNALQARQQRFQPRKNLPEQDGPALTGNKEKCSAINCHRKFRDGNTAFARPL